MRAIDPEVLARLDDPQALESQVLDPQVLRPVSAHTLAAVEFNRAFPVTRGDEIGICPRRQPPASRSANANLYGDGIRELLTLSRDRCD
jgi:hypothetical protein